MNIIYLINSILDLEMFTHTTRLQNHCVQLKNSSMDSPTRPPPHVVHWNTIYIGTVTKNSCSAQVCSLGEACKHWQLHVREYMAIIWGSSDTFQNVRVTCTIFWVSLYWINTWHSAKLKLSHSVHCQLCMRHMYVYTLQLQLLYDSCIRPEYACYTL